MAIMLKTALVRISSIQIMQVRVKNKGKSVWKSRYDGDVSAASLTSTPSLLDCICSKKDPREGFVPFGFRLILFCETLK